MVTFTNLIIPFFLQDETLEWNGMEWNGMEWNNFSGTFIYFKSKNFKATCIQIH